MPKKSAKKIYIIGLIIIIVIVGILLPIAKSSNVTKKGIVDVLSFVLKTDVELGSMNLSLSKGECVLNNLVIKNPEGFSNQNAFSAGKINVDFNAKLFNPMKPEVQSIIIEKPLINMEISGKSSNLGKLSENASRMEKWKFKNIGSKIKINKTIIEGGKVSLFTTKSKDKPVSFNLSKIEIENLGGPISETVKAFFERILRESVKAGKEHILKLGSNEAIKSLQEAIDGISEKAEKAGETIKEGIRDLKDAIKDKLER